MPLQKPTDTGNIDDVNTGNRREPSSGEGYTVPNTEPIYSIKHSDT